MKGLRGLRVLVTGGAQGIGWAVGERFVNEGARVAFSDIRGDGEFRARVAALAPAKAGPHLALTGDVADEKQAARIVRQAIRGLGGLDVLINNAGIQIRSASHATTTADFARVMGINVNGMFFCSRASIAHFLKAGKGGQIITTSSVHEMIPKPNYLSYSASKAAIHNMTRTLALEYAGHGIRVNAVAPGGTVTPMNPSLNDPKVLKRAGKTVPIGRIATAEEVAGAFAFLASDDASYITGHTITVDGGLSLYPEYAAR